MPRRRLMLRNYSDEEDDDETQQPLQRQLQLPGYEITPQQEPAVNFQPLNQNPSPIDSVPISDDEFIDVSDNLSTPSISPDTVASIASPPPSVLPASSGSSIGEFLLRMGSNVRREWLDSCIQELGGSIEGLDVAAKAKHSATMRNHDCVFMAEKCEHPIILSGDLEKPFTYIASLSAQWAAMKNKTSSVRGKIKCNLTNVKEFQLKYRTKYGLRVHVDDGSLISEISIDHNVVQEKIGHSPEEVNAGIFSPPDPNTAAYMRETMRRFQTFVSNFEGRMLLEMNHTSPIPIALSMDEGFAASDAWLLVKRLTSTGFPQTPQRPTTEPIEISPQLNSREKSRLILIKARLL